MTPLTLTVPVLMETTQAREACRVCESRWPTYWRAHRALRDGTRKVGKRRYFLASAVAKHIEKEMPR